MTKKHFIALADAIREHNRKMIATGQEHLAFNETQLVTLSNAFLHINSNYRPTRWMDYVEGKCGPNGGAR